MFGDEANGFYWGHTAAAHSGGNGGKGKKQMRVVGQSEGTRYVLAMDGVHTKEGEINPS